MNENTVREFFSLIQVHDTPFTRVRVGREADGGYVVLKELLEGAQRLYSFGVADDVSFEEHWTRLNPQCDVLLFDHTIDKLPSDNPRFRFVKKGLSAQRTGDMDTLKAHAGPPGPRSVLKMDIEWGEWEVFLGVDDEVLERFDQVICEFHVVPSIYHEGGFHTPYFTAFHKNVYESMNEWIFARYAQAMRNVLKHHVIFHLHPNNSLAPVEVQGVRFPPLLEMSFVNRRFVSDAGAIRHELPVPGLDFPNKPYKPEITHFYPFPA